jgi:hypothetical protein
MNLLEELSEGSPGNPIRIPVANVVASSDNDEVSVGVVKSLDIGRRAVTAFANVEIGAPLLQSRTRMHG